jgi:enterochelin esterase-like enzyme
MEIEKQLILREQSKLTSTYLDRDVIIDFYLPTNVASPGEISLLLINDGQDLSKMDFESILNSLYEQRKINPVLCVGIHCGPERKMEYGTVATPDFKGRGARAGQYSSFIFNELLPFIQTSYFLESFKLKAFAGFSLGGLSALDTVWNHPEQFSIAGVFSGSFWWRTRDQDDPDYNDDSDRIMQQQIRKSSYKPGLKFFFQCGADDEKKDRNQNGIIDSIDDTLDVISELKSKGYTDEDIKYLLIEDGRHDVQTWGKAMPVFLEWAFKK